MEGEEPDDKRLRSIPSLPVWIIEYAWAHKMMDVQEVVDLSTWPEVDPQPLALKDSCRLRVASAQAYSIMKHRDVGRFERVMAFLEATYRFLPGLVAPIKHMKIMFGLKTMVIMWMLREGQDIVDTVVKTIKFFPGKLPQYQDQCSRREMFLMRKNHQDFKALAQTLAMDKNKLEGYIKNQMEEQYGEHYAQRLEDRLLHYLHQLEAVLPRDTYIDELLKKNHPMTKEEKLLLEVITCDSTNIVTSLKRLLRCDAASCFLIRVSQKAGQGAEIENALCAGSSRALVEGKTPVELQPEMMDKREEAAQDLPEDSPLLLEDDEDSEVRSHQPTEEQVEEVEDMEAFRMVEDQSNCDAKEVGNVTRTQEEEEGEKEKKEGEDDDQEENSESIQYAVLPQFCSRHQRWVESILRGCPDECSEELLAQEDATTSPTLFQSSCSTSSSQDLTPSLLIPCPPAQQHPPLQTSSSTPPQAAAQVSDTKSYLSANSPQSESLLHLVSSRGTPVVLLKNIASTKGDLPPIQPHQVSPTHFTVSNNEQAQTAPQAENPSTSTSCLPPSTLCKLSREFRQAPPSFRHFEPPTQSSHIPLPGQSRNALTDLNPGPNPLSTDSRVSGHPTPAATSTAQPGTLSLTGTANQTPLADQVIHPQQVTAPQTANSIHPHLQILNHSLNHSQTLPCSTGTSHILMSNDLTDTSEALRAQLQLSLQSQALLQVESTFSTSFSSQDLTPSLLIPCPPAQQHPPIQTSTPPQAAAQVSDTTTPVDKPGTLSAGPVTNSPQTESLLHLVSSRGTPVVLLKDITSTKGDAPPIQPQQVSTVSNNEQAASTSHSQLLAPPSYRHTPRDEEAAFTQLQTVSPPNPTNATYRPTHTHLPPPPTNPEFTTSVSEHPRRQTAPQAENPSTSTSCLPPTVQRFCRLSRTFRQAPTQSSHIPLPGQSGKAPTDLNPGPNPLSTDSKVSGHPTPAATSTAQPGTLSLTGTANQTPLADQVIHPQQVTAPQTANSIHPHLQVLNHSLNHSQTLPCSTGTSHILMSNDLTDRPEALRAQLQLSLQSQALLQVESSFSTSSSSQDLTPSLLIPCPPAQQHPPIQTSTPPQAAAQVSDTTTPVDKPGTLSAGPVTNSPQTESLLHLVSSRGTPVVLLKDITSTKGDAPPIQPQQVSTVSNNEQAASTSHSQLLAPPSYRHTPRDEEAAFTQPQTVSSPHPTNATYRPTHTHLPPPPANPEFTTSVFEHPRRQTAPQAENPSTSTSCLPPTVQRFCRLSRTFRQAPTQSSHIPLPGQSGKALTDLNPGPNPLSTDSKVSGHPTPAATSTAQPGTLSLTGTANQTPLADQVIHPQQVTAPQTANSIHPHLQILNHSLNHSQTLPCSTGTSHILTSNGLTDRPEALRAQLTLSLQSQALLLQSKLLQPRVKLTRLSRQDCRTAVGERFPTRVLQSVEEGGSSDDNDDDGGDEANKGENSSFDLNTLYSSDDSSSSDSEDSQDTDYILPRYFTRNSYQ